MIKIIAALSENNVIGIENRLPWKLPADMNWFKDQTGNFPVAMGLTTFLSLPDRFRPLTGRENIVLSRKPRPELYHQATVISDWRKLLDRSRLEDIFVMGGGQIYRLFLPYAHDMYLTRVHVILAGDTSFPCWDRSEWSLVFNARNIQDERNQYDYTWEVWRRK